MYKKISVKSIIEIGLLGILTFLIVLAGLKVPVLSYLSLVLSVIPIVIITYRYSEKAAASASVLVFAATLLLLPVPDALIRFFIYGTNGISMGYSLLNRFSLKKSVVVGAVSAVATFAIAYMIILKFYGINIMQEFINGTMADYKSNKAFFDNANKVLVSAFNAPPLDFDAMLDNIFLNIPSYITTLAFIVGFIVIIFSVMIIRKMGYNTYNIEPFSQLKLPKGLVWGLFIFDFLIWGVDFQGRTVPGWAVVFLNIETILNFFFTVQGLALLDFWFKKIGLKGFLKVLVYVFASVPLMFFSFFLTIAGILESLMNFRRLEAE